MRNFVVAVALIVGCGIFATVHAAPSGEPAAVREVFELNAAIRAKQARLTELQQRIEEYRASIIREQTHAQTLQQRLAVVEDRIAKKRLDIEHVATEQERVELEMRATRRDLTHAKEKIARERRLIAVLFSELRSIDSAPPIHVFLASSSIGSYLAQRTRIAQVQDRLHAILTDVHSERVQLERAERSLTDHQRELEAFSDRLEEERTALQEEQDGKESLLATTRSNERKYQTLVEEYKAEQRAIDDEIVAMESRIRKQLEAIDASFGALGRVAFSRPVPNRGITTQFHDPEYPFRHIFEHPGLDLRASQGSPIAATAPGYVARAKDAGYGYSYIMIVHPGGFSTVYGHVSRIDVAEGTYVTRGQVIGAVGGRPGTRGAGPLTTGPHLHFEIRLNGIPVNPRNYMTS
ncbi:peptidoglycan DD-metalloendopeptidase family protein [Candidatus Uhrbacteria bacterium]|nr:peptidoglycan DD-metalloendopeptidase family protein [Candidatus Uhrbacteria bacterium]